MHIVSDIANASVEQATGLEEVNKSLTQMDEVTQQNSALVEENAATAKTLEQQARVMDEHVAAFRIDVAEAAPMPVRVQRSIAAPAKSSGATKSRPVMTPKRASVAAPRRAAGTNGGAVARMQATIATAINSEDDWKEFSGRKSGRISAPTADGVDTISSSKRGLRASSCFHGRRIMSGRMVLPLRRQAQNERPSQN